MVVLSIGGCPCGSFPLSVLARFEVEIKMGHHIRLVGLNRTDVGDDLYFLHS